MGVDGRNEVKGGGEVALMVDCCDWIDVPSIYILRAECLRLVRFGVLLSLYSYSYHA